MPVAFAPGSRPSPGGVRRALDRLRATIPGDVVPTYEQWSVLSTSRKEEIVRGMDRALDALYKLDSITWDQRGSGQLSTGTLLTEIEYEIYGDAE